MQIQSAILDIVKSYLGDKEFRHLKKVLSKETTLQKEGIADPIDTSSKKSAFITIDSKDYRNKIECIITESEKILSEGKYLDLLLTLGKASIALGESTLSKDLFELVIAKVTEDTKYSNYKANAFLGLGEVYSNQAYWKESLKCLAKAKNIFQNEKDMTGYARCENLIGTIYGDRGNLSKAKKQFEKSLSLLHPQKDKYMMGIIEDNLGIVNHAQDNFDEAISYFYRALSKFSQVSDHRRISEVRYNLGLLFLQKREYDSALTELENSIAEALKAEYMPTIGLSYFCRSNVYAELNDFPLAIAFADKAMEISYKINDRLSIADIYRVKGIIQRKLENKELSENYLQTSLRMNKELDNKFNQAETSFELGLLYKEWK